MNKETEFYSTAYDHRTRGNEITAKFTITMRRGANAEPTSIIWYNTNNVQTIPTQNVLGGRQ